MEDLKKINSTLIEACSLLDTAVRELAKTELIQKKAWIKLIGQSLASIIELQRGIYLEQPDLKPEYLNNEARDKSTNRQFGEIILGIQSVLAKNQPLKAIEALENFIQKSPPEYLINAAKAEILKIKTNFKM